MRLAAIASFYQRHDKTLPLFRRVLVESTRPPDELWVMCEGEDDVAVARDALATLVAIGVVVTGNVIIQHTPTPRDESGAKAVIPYSYAINAALDQTAADAIVYVDNGAMPHRDKYRLMVRGLEAHPEWGAVYCGQRRTGYAAMDAHTVGVVNDAYCVLNWTQVMHRPTADRWTLDLQWANPDLADARFWRSLHASLGAFHPVAEGELLDEHHMEGPHALGIE